VATSEQERAGRQLRSVRALLAAWAAYWAGLVAFAFWTPAMLILRLKRQQPESHPTLTVNEELRARLTLDGAEMWAGATTLAELLAWVAAGPLVSWLVWLWWVGRRPGRGAGVGAAGVAGGVRPPDVAALPDGRAAAAPAAPDGTRARVRRG
jgi:hypothetical protein